MGGTRQDTQDIQAFHPFLKLNRLLDGLAPGPGPGPDGAPLNLHIGEPQGAPPAWLGARLAEATGWNRYPPPRGTAAFRAACHGWLTRRHGPTAAAAVDPERHILPLPGSREGLFFAALSAVRPGRDVVLLPNPFYHVYAGAAVAAGATPVFVPATAASGFQPDYTALDAATLDRAALAYLNTPANPQGAVADRETLAAALSLARRHDFLLVLDECYAALYDTDPPPGGLDVLTEAGPAPGGAPLANLLCVHSLSKRSSAPGLRCGFACGDPRWLDPLDAALRVGGAGVPLPVLAAGAALWEDEAHVAENRAHYRAAFDIAERALGAGHRPAAGFFLWLDVGDGEAAARALWQDAGLRVLPGAYMSVPDARGHNPGAAYIRVALVHEPEVVAPALTRLAEVLAGQLAPLSAGAAEAAGAGAR